MTKTTAQKVLDMFRDSEAAGQDFMYAYSGMKSLETVIASREYKVKPFLEGLEDLVYSLEKVYHVGGEGEGENYETVWRFEDIETREPFFIEFEGYYYSYDGATYTGCALVEPYTFTETRYKK